MAGGDVMADVVCILVNYRNPEDTVACIRSLAAAGLRGFRILLFDNSAADGGGESLRKALAESGLPHRYADPGGNIGYTAAVNLGIGEAMASGAGHVMLLNNDTVVEPGFGPALAEALGRHPDAVLAGCVLEADTGEASWNIGTLSPWTGQVRHIFAAEYSGPVEFVSGCLAVVPVAAYRKVGLLDERYFMYCEDLDFCIRLKAAGIPIRYAPAMRLRHRTSSSTVRTGTPKEYYRIRNQTHVVLARGSALQKLAYLLWLAGMVPYKLVRRPGLFNQAVRGAWDGLRGRLGRARA
jgi:GT2 family glycosyltransferase